MCYNMCYNIHYTDMILYDIIFIYIIVYNIEYSIAYDYFACVCIFNVNVLPKHPCSTPFLLGRAFGDLLKSK